jgi:DNA-binding winged helix-turn-helix (wHTH) protein
MKNEILAEVWRNRDAFAKRCNYDLRRMIEALRRVEQDPRNPLVHAKKKSTSKRTQLHRP